MILIAAGHHPYSRGHEYAKATEYDEAKKWAAYVANFLGAEGMAVPSGTLKEKLAFAAEVSSVALMVELHFNGAESPGGCETLYQPQNSLSECAARLVQDNLGRVMEPSLGAKVGLFSMEQPERGLHFFLERSKFASVIVVPESIQNIKVIRSKMEVACASIAGAIEDWRMEVCGNKRT